MSPDDPPARTPRLPDPWPEFAEDRAPRTVDGALEVQARVIGATAAAAAQGIELGPLLGWGGSSCVLAARAPGFEPAALKIPWEVPSAPEGSGPGPHGVLLVSPTGPFVHRGTPRLEESAALLRSALGRQVETTAGAPLPRLLATYTLAGLPAGLYERIDLPPAFARVADDPGTLPEVMRRLAGAVRALHRSFGPHGDLTPEHVRADAARVVLLDPLVDAPLYGTAGYALPFPLVAFAGPWAPYGELRDLGAMAAMAARAVGGDLGWSAELAVTLGNQGNGRFGAPVDWDGIERRMIEDTVALPPELRAWCRRVARTVHDLWRGTPSPPGFAERMLRELESVGDRPR